MSIKRKPGRKEPPSRRMAAKSMATAALRRASIFRNGANQAVRLPQELRFPEQVTEVRIRKQGDNLVLCVFPARMRDGSEVEAVG